MTWNLQVMEFDCDRFSSMSVANSQDHRSNGVEGFNAARRRRVKSFSS